MIKCCRLKSFARNGAITARMRTPVNVSKPVNGCVHLVLVVIVKAAVLIAGSSSWGCSGKGLSPYAFASAFDLFILTRTDCGVEENANGFSVRVF